MAASTIGYFRADIGERQRQFVLDVFLRRKASGLYLLAAKLKARVDIRALFLPYASRQAPS